MDRVPTQYARNGDVHLAFQVRGEGPVDLLFLPIWWGHVELLWESPLAERFFGRLARFSRLILYDRRGTGLSDPVPPGSLPTVDDLVADAHAVLDAAGSSRATLLGNFEGGTTALMMAASDPNRVDALVLVDSYARFTRAPDYPWGMPEEVYGRVLDRMREEWGSGATARWLVPSKAEDRAFVDWYARYERQSVSPGMAVAMGRVNAAIDVRPVLSSISCPTLVVQRSEDRWVRRGHGRYLADHIEHSHYVELPGADAAVIGADQEQLLDHILEFLIGSPARREPDRVLATVMFTDIVDSTRIAGRLGDAAWGELVGQHESVVRRLLDRYAGRAIKTLGDGFLVTFEGPANAIRCGCAVVDAVRAIGLDVRVGIHTGEVAFDRDDIAGITVNIAKRVESEARRGTVFVTRTVRDLLAGSSFEFLDEGAVLLKGLSEPWQLYSVGV